MPNVEDIARAASPRGSRGARRAAARSLQFRVLMALRRFRHFNRTPRLLLLSVVMGAVGALAAAVFIWMVDLAHATILAPIGGYHILTEYQAVHLTSPPPTPHWLWLLPVATTVGGLLSGALVYRFAPEAEGHGTDAAVKAYHHLNGVIRARVPLVKSVASALTIGSGGAAGREGPIVQVAGGLGSVLGRMLRLPPEEQRNLLLIGMAAGLSAVFKSPLGSAIFAVEVLYSTMAFEGGILIYTFTASAVAYAIAGLLTGWRPLFFLPSAIMPLERGLDLVWFALLGTTAGLVGAVLPTVFYRARDFFRDLKIPNPLKPALGGLLLGLMGIAVPQVLGGGYGWMQLAIAGSLPLLLMAVLVFAKMAALALTVGSGGSGGVFAPSIFVGAMLGGAMAMLVKTVAHPGPDPTAFVVVGMAALFAGAARVPIATLIMVTEMTGGYALILPSMLAVVLSFVIQSALTRSVKYPTLYEAHVRRPAESPVHRTTYYNAVAAMLRQHKVRLDEDLVRQEVTERLASGEAIPLALGSHGQEYLFTVDLPARSPLVGHALRAISMPTEVLLVSVMREQDVITPHGDTVLESGDRLVVAATREGFDRFFEIMSEA
jgi:CIC family chloride channel protein